MARVVRDEINILHVVRLCTQSQTGTYTYTYTYIYIYIYMESSFKSRFRNHKMSFNNGKYSSSTTLSTHIWKLKKTNTKHKVQWSIIKCASAFRSGAKQCNLCLAEKLCILKADKQSLLNKSSELLSKCRHRNKFYASNYKPP